MVDNKDEPLEFDDSYEAELEDEFYDDSFEDDFSSDMAEEFDDVDYGLEEEFEEEFDQAVETSQNKKSGFSLSFNTIVIGAALIVGGIVLYTQVTKTPPAQQQGERFVSAVNLQGADDGILAEQDSEQAANQAEDQSEAENVETEINQETAFLFEPDLLDEMEETLNTIPQPAPVMEVEDQPQEIRPNIEDIVLDNFVAEEQMIEQSPAQDVVQEVAELPQPRSPQNLEQITPDVSVEDNMSAFQDDSSAAQLDLNDEVKEASVEVTENSPEALSEVVTTNVDLSAVETKLDQITGRLEKMDEQMAQMQGDIRGELADVQKNVSALEKRVERISNRPASSQPKKTTSLTKKVVKKPAPVAPVSWELKAAQPGKAWIAKSGSSQIKPIQVGDSVEGLGTIRDILYVNGKWRVTGSITSLEQ